VAKCLHPEASQLPSAIEELEAVTKLYPNDPLLYEALARNYELQGRFAQTPAKRELALFKANDARIREKRLRKM
jgi:predicted Zn-dependent protease